MVEPRINQLLEIINQQKNLQLVLQEQLSKATSLVRVSLDQDFLTHPSTIIYCYLWTLDDLVEKSRDLNDQTLALIDRANLKPDFL